MVWITSWRRRVNVFAFWVSVLKKCDCSYQAVHVSSVFSFLHLASGSCFVFGEGHFNTFDNMAYRFNGTCDHTLVMDRENTDSLMVVLNGDPDCNLNVKCQKSLNLTIDNVKVFLGRKTNTSFVVKVNGRPVSLPYTGSPIMRVVSCVSH